MRFLFIFGPAAILFYFASTHLIDLPGLYMDAINPDYQVVQILHPTAPDLADRTLPGVMLWDRWPVISQIYHGALPLYVGLPVYWLFGTGIIGIRLANTLFGLLTLAGGAMFLRAWQIRPFIAALTLCALAIDPGFLFVWRTQFYITTLPIAFLLTSVALMQSRQAAPARWTTGLAGLLAGIACYGYFIFGFLAPAAFLHAVNILRRGHKTMLAWWLIGFVIGVAPYALGLLLIWRSFGNFAEFIAYVQDLVHGLNPTESQLALAERAALFWQYFNQTLLGIGPKAMIIAELPDISPKLRFVALFVLPLAGLGLWFIPKVRPPALPLLAGFVAGIFCLTMAFGNRLWLHHFALLVPLLYVAVACIFEGLIRAVSGRVAPRALLAGVGAILFGLMIEANAVDAKDVFIALNRTGGVGFSSDAIDRFAFDSLAKKERTFYFFPDWGAYTGFVMLTDGKRPFALDMDPDVAHAKLCDGQDAAVVLMMGKEPGRVRKWTDAIRWSEPELSTYHQRNGPDVLTVAQWKGAARPPGVCDK